jgi:hypothetical protein
VTARAAAILAIVRSTLDTVERLDDPAERDEIFGALRADLAARPSAGLCANDDDELRRLAEDRVAQLVARRPRRASGTVR